MFLVAASLSSSSADLDCRPTSTARVDASRPKLRGVDGGRPRARITSRRRLSRARARSGRAATASPANNAAWCAERLQRGAAHVGSVCPVASAFCAHQLEQGPRLEKAIIVSVILAGSLHCQYIRRVAGRCQYVCVRHSYMLFRDRNVPLTRKSIGNSLCF